MGQKEGGGEEQQEEEEVEEQSRACWEFTEPTADLESVSRVLGASWAPAGLKAGGK